jgi:uncharacterized RDD family membrane protein YckC
VNAGEVPASLPVPPPLVRRLACFLYEGVLLFGVVMTAGLVYAAVTDQRHALVGQRGLQCWLFVVIGAYFIGFWVRQGQTLAMRTWRIGLVDATGRRPSLARAACRYLLTWLWFLPALYTLHAGRLQGGFTFTVVLFAGVLTYAALARLHPQRQFLHDALCGTRLVDLRRSAVSR